MQMVTSTYHSIQTYLSKDTEAAPLAAFRILFGLLMLFTISRFFYYDWIDKFYIQPDFFFSFYGFSWVKPFGQSTYLLFGLCGISSLMVLLGFYYRASMVVFFLSFSYIELMDKTYYLNHYYFILVISFLMIFLPCHRYFSVDAYRSGYSACRQYIPRWTIDAIRVFLTIVYLYAGLAKLNTDWLLEAAPLNIWLSGQTDLPFIGKLFSFKEVHYLFSWGGMLYDVFIAFLLWYPKTRKLSFFAVIFFHIMTAALFPIGVFPWVMIGSATIFFGYPFHKIWLSLLAKAIGIKLEQFDNNQTAKDDLTNKKLTIWIITIVLCIQLIFPWRFTLYPGNLFWTEQGYRFSWRVMLMEKAGIATFKIVDGVTGNRFYVDNNDFLNTYQIKQMATQPDFIIEYAHYLRDHFSSQGHQQVEVYVESYATLNGRPSRPFIDPSVNLATEAISLSPKKWILPYE